MPAGSCLCGAVTFRVEGPLKPPDACHCTRCRKHSGHYFVSTDIPKANLNIAGDDNLSWFHSSPQVRRGFCKQCGSSLFWDPHNLDWIGVAMGAFDGPTETEIGLHIYVENRGDYYKIAEGERCYQRTPRDS